MSCIIEAPTCSKFKKKLIILNFERNIYDIWYIDRSIFVNWEKFYLAKIVTES